MRCVRVPSRQLLANCQPCGEVFVGGYKEHDDASNNAWYLSPDYPNLERVPDKAASLSRTFGEFLVFWPADGKTLFKENATAGPKWKWQQDSARDVPVGACSVQSLVRADSLYKAASGPLLWRASPAATCSWRRSTTRTRFRQSVLTAAPIGPADVGLIRRSVTSVRAFNESCSWLTDSLMRQIPLGPSRKLVLFSDSRSDAAKLSTGRQTRTSPRIPSGRSSRAAYTARSSRPSPTTKLRLKSRARAVELLALERRQASEGLRCSRLGSDAKS